MTVDLGTPTHQPWCPDCKKPVGGKYFDKYQARQRLREHQSFAHNGAAMWHWKRPALHRARDFARGSFNG